MARNNRSNKTGEVRDFLFEHMKKAASGELQAHEIRGVVGMANQIHLSMTAEIKRIDQAVRLGQRHEAFGEMAVG